MLNDQRLLLSRIQTKSFNRIFGPEVDTEDQQVHGCVERFRNQMLKTPKIQINTLSFTPLKSWFALHCIESESLFALFLPFY